MPVSKALFACPNCGHVYYLDPDKRAFCSLDPCYSMGNLGPDCPGFALEKIPLPPSLFAVPEEATHAPH